MDIRKKYEMNFRKKFQTDLHKISQMDFNIFGWTQRAPLLGPKGLTVAAEGCSPPQELEKAARREVIFLVSFKVWSKFPHYQKALWFDPMTDIFCNLDFSKLWSVFPTKPGRQTKQFGESWFA